jgi:hypothetical protein
MKKYTILSALSVLLVAAGFATAQESEKDLPVATQLLFESLTTTGRETPRAVFKILCGPAKGTGFALDTGYVVTNAHVVEGCVAADLAVISASGKHIQVTDLVVDDARDLAVARLSQPVSGGLKIDTALKRTGAQVSAWGHPLIYDGPPPLLTVGYLSGFAFEPPPSTQYKLKTKPIQQLIVNAAVNPGNSGGPLTLFGDDAVIGVIVSKATPITPYARMAIDVLSKQHSGLIYPGTDGQGKPISFTEAQIVAQVLESFYQMSQVVIGQAIRASELTAFLDEHKIPWTAKSQGHPQPPSTKK